MKSLTFLALALTACGAATEQTRRTFPVEVVGEAPTHVTQAGWTVSLTSATASLAAGRFYTGKVLLAERHFHPMDWLIGSAWAHPGHYQRGEALGEVLTPVEVDLLGAAQSWGVANAVTGDYGSMQLAYGVDGLRLKGSASKDGHMVVFDTGAFSPPSPVEGIAFERVVDTKPGKVVVTIKLGALLERVDFSQGNPGGGDVLDPGSVAYNGYARGVMDTSVYAVEWRDQ